MEKYLLRYRYQYDAFRKEYNAVIRNQSMAFRDWVLSLPWMKWVELRFRNEQEARAVIGIICVLYWDMEINISFSDDMTCIRNEPRNDEELLAWMKADGWHGKRIDK